MWLCVPFFFVSVWLEAWAVERWIPASATQYLKAWSRQANLVSYGLFEALLAALLIFCLVTIDA